MHRVVRISSALVLLGAVGLIAVGAGKSSGARRLPARVPRTVARPTKAAAAAAHEDWRAPLTSAMQQGIDRAEARGGQAAAAIWVGGWASPATAGDVGRVDRLWSISKPVVATALLLRARPGPEVTQAMNDAITRSDNCAQRHLVLSLQEATGSTGAAEASFLDVLSRAGVPIVGQPQIGPISDDPVCAADLESAHDLVRPMAPALLFGTLNWSVTDAVRFAHALGSGVYGAAGQQVLGVMRLPKQHGLQPTWRTDYTAPLDLPPSGGDFPASWHPAYKGGWGGASRGEFSASQIVVLRVREEPVAIGVRFWPAARASSDDPGATVAPWALEDVMRAVRATLERLEEPSS